MTSHMQDMIQQETFHHTVRTSPYIILFIISDHL